ncbi:vWA domain-containing protein [Actinacidiphila sp. bgisy144]|uniref:vWA domain-containing protein n=1 Tax=unclassified Actinacidiphila TaxID=2995708 RepID=UPI003EBAE47A
MMTYRSHLAAAAALLLALGGAPAAGAVGAPGGPAVQPRAVPAPGPDSSVVTVRTGGDRDPATDTVLPLAGVRLALFRDADAADPIDAPWAQCTSDADGDCNFVVPQTGAGEAENGSVLTVRQLAAPAGWYTNPVLRTGPGSGSNSVASPYEFQTPALEGGATYRSTREFMYSSSNSLPTRSGGIWQSSRDNPPLPQSCGLDVAVVLDLSASVGSQLPALKAATDAFTDALTGTPSRLALFSFDQASPATSVDANHPELRSVSTPAGAAAFKSLYADWTLGKGTNWDRALHAVAQAPEHYDATVVLTDGNPTRFGSLHGDGANTHFIDVENGIFSANSVKAQDTRVIALGVGSGVAGLSGLNLRAISGPTAFDGGNTTAADYFQTTDYGQAADQLRALALEHCTGSLTVVKQIAPEDTTGEDVTGAEPAGPGWTFDASTTTPGVTGLPATQTTTSDGTGAVTFQPGFGVNPSADVTVGEIQHPGYALVTQDGGNAVCTDLDTGQRVPVENTGTDEIPGFTVDAPRQAAISCTVYNRPVGSTDDSADITVDKEWNVDGHLYAEGTQPDGLSAQLTLTGPGGAGATPQPWGDPRTGYTIGDRVTVAESVHLTAPGCTLGGSEVTSVDGAGTHLPLPYDATLTAHHQHLVVTNTVTCCPDDGGQQGYGAGPQKAQPRPAAVHPARR